VKNETEEEGFVLTLDQTSARAVT